MHARETVLTVLHLAASAQLAVLARLYIGSALGAACHSNLQPTFLPCVTSPGLVARGGALFIDLPSNALGSFILGLFSQADALKSNYLTEIAGSVPLLPQRNALQAHTPFLVGVRTGFCGTLTTYASWLLQMVRMLVGGAPSSFDTEWVAALSGLFVGHAVALQSLLLGQQLAVVAWRLHSSQEPPDIGKGPLGVHESTLAPLQHSAVADGTLSKSSALPALCQNSPETQQQQQQQRDQQRPDPLASSPSAYHCLPTFETPETPPGMHAGFLFWGGNLAALLTLCTLTGVSLAYLVLDLQSEVLSAGQPRAYVWFSILLAPFGCVLRWQLSRLNAPSFLKGTTWSWLPLGTLLANQIALAIDVMIAILSVRLRNFSLAQDSALFAAIGGFGGALSTVSTWMMEVQKLNVEEPWRARGYLYATITIALSLLVGIIGYGVSTWTL